MLETVMHGKSDRSKSGWIFVSYNIICLQKKMMSHTFPAVLRDEWILQLFNDAFNCIGYLASSVRMTE
jgi:hypothetical protein